MLYFPRDLFSLCDILLRFVSCHSLTLAAFIVSIYATAVSVFVYGILRHFVMRCCNVNSTYYSYLSSTDLSTDPFLVINLSKAFESISSI